MEKREFSRVHYEVHATIRHDAGESPCGIIDLSLHGMYVTTSAPVAVGDPIEVAFSLGGEADAVIVQTAGHVVRKDDNGVGIEFDQTDLDSFDAMKNIVALNSGRPGEITEEFRRFVARRAAAATS